MPRIRAPHAPSAACDVPQPFGMAGIRPSKWLHSPGKIIDVAETTSDQDLDAGMKSAEPRTLNREPLEPCDPSLLDIRERGGVLVDLDTAKRLLELDRPLNESLGHRHDEFFRCPIGVVHRDGERDVVDGTLLLEAEFQCGPGHR